MDRLLDIVHEDDDLLVVDKPADLVCHPTKDGEWSSLAGRVRLHLGTAAWLVNRLDRETSGLVLVARSRDVARELGRVWAARRVEKRYLALVSGHVRDDAGTIDAPIGPHPDSRVAIRNAVRPDGAAACTDYTVLERRPGPSTLLGLSPRTGRKHQLRVHLAHLGHPVVGDKLYGAREEDYLDFVAGRLSAERRAALQLPHHALHAASLAFDWRGRSWRFDAGRPGWAAAAPGNATG